MDFKQLEKLFWQATMQILGLDPTIPENVNKVRRTYSTDGQPAWKIDEDVVFIRLFEKEDDYTKQLDSVYEPRASTVIKQSARTRVWEVQYVAYGPVAHANINKIKDGVFRQDVKRLLSASSVFLIPNLPTCKRVPELFGGQWWNRWDTSLNFNELYRLPDEDVGRIESVSVATYYNR
ncbi:aldehyde dehydrogenase [Sporomusa aerivorans]|uniref:phage neck terminator protein n=1 Tax=Sporomusa aerivorans TaxID=204936 RepID=UPI00352B72E2